MRNPKNILIQEITIATILSLFLALIPTIYSVEIKLIGISLQLSFAAIFFFVYTLFLHTKLSESSWYPVIELLKDKLLLSLLWVYFLTLIINAIISIFNLNELYKREFFKMIYTFINIFSLFLVFSIYLFFVRLIKPTNHAAYLISKLRIKRVIKYELYQCTEKDGYLTLKPNKYSKDIKIEDPLMAVHELLGILIKKEDYRSIGAVINYLLIVAHVKRFSVNQTKKALYIAHILDYIISLIRNIYNKEMYGWRSLNSFRHFSYVFLKHATKDNSNQHSYVKDLQRLALIKLVKSLILDHPHKIKELNFNEHISILRHSSNDSLLSQIERLLLNPSIDTIEKLPKLAKTSRIDIYWG